MPTKVKRKVKGKVKGKSKKARRQLRNTRVSGALKGSLGIYGLKKQYAKRVTRNKIAPLHHDEKATVRTDKRWTFRTPKLVMNLNSKKTPKTRSPKAKKKSTLSDITLDENTTVRPDRRWTFRLKSKKPPKTRSPNTKEKLTLSGKRNPIADHSI